MSRTKLLLDVIQDMRSLADSLQAIADVIGQNDPPAEAPAPSPEPAAEVTVPKPAAAPPKPKENPITLEQVRSVLAEKSHDGYTDQVRKLLGKYGALKLSGIDPKHYAALLKDAEVIGSAAP